MADRAHPLARGDPRDLSSVDRTRKGALVAEEMLSGPDLGGGYLHQLTVQPREPRARFTFHAQSGGADASGPPLGSLEPFGWVHPPTPCPFGGPRCFHRSFELPLHAASVVRPAYNRFRFVLGTLLEQQYSHRLPAIEAALAEIVARLGAPGAGESVGWYVGGSTAAWLQGAALHPRDIDLGTDADGAARIAERLQEYLIEPFAFTSWGNEPPGLAGRAFVGTLREGARVEWRAPPGPSRAGRDDEEWSGDPKRVRTRAVVFHGGSVRVTRPEYALVRALEKGFPDRARKIRQSLEPLGVDRALLAGLVDRSSLADAQRRAALVEFLG